MILLDHKGHLVSDINLRELHHFATLILKLKPEWFQNRHIPHYDLTSTRKKQLAIQKGATLVTSKTLVRRAVKS